MKRPGPQERLADLLARTPRRPASREKVVIVSDLHMGQGDRTDDFQHNGALFLEAFEKFYLDRDYTVVLNGDVEELLRVPRQAILAAWKPVYDLFDRFRDQGRLVWLKGNHEILPAQAGDPFHEGHFDGESVLLDYPEGQVFVFHGHQAGVANSGRFNHLIGWSLRFFANNLGIMNKSISHDSEKKFKLESAVYEFSRRQGLMSVIGHTHRPLFESLSKKEDLGIRIDRMCRDYPGADEGRRSRIRRTIRDLRRAYLETRSVPHLATTVYGEMPVPCVFNAGCAVGKRGFTTLEIVRGKAALVFWSTPDRSPLPGAYNENKESRRFGRDAYRTILRRESLAYVFSRIELLGEL